MRRRQRWLRQFLRHERLSVAMALAEFTHHTAPRRPTMARARGEESEVNNATGQMTPLPRRQALCTEGWTTTGTCLPPGRHLLMRCGHCRGYSGTPRRTPRTSCRSCRSSMCLCRSWGDRVVDLLREIDAPALVEQVIAVPKISMDRVPQRSVCRRSRRAEQLVEVPTIASYSHLQQRTAKQIVDIPVPRGHGGRVGHGGLQGFSQGQGSTVFRALAWCGG